MKYWKSWNICSRVTRKKAMFQRSAVGSERAGSDPKFHENVDDIKFQRKQEFKPGEIKLMALGDCHILDISISIALLYKSESIFYFSGPIPFVLSFILMGSVLYSVLVQSKPLETSDRWTALTWRNDIISTVPLRQVYPCKNPFAHILLH